MVAVDDRLCRAETSEKEVADTSILGGNDMFCYNLLVWFLVKGLFSFFIKLGMGDREAAHSCQQIKTCLSWQRNPW